MNYSLLPPRLKSRYYEPRPEWRQRLAERRAEIVAMRLSGMTQDAIGKKLKISRQRVHQVLKREGLSGVRDKVKGAE